MENNPDKTLEQKELDITTPEGMAVFLQTADQICNEVFERQSLSSVEDIQIITVDDVSLSKVFDKVSELRRDLHALTSSLEVENLSDKEIDELQGLYNQLVDLRYVVAETYEQISQEEESDDEADVLPETKPESPSVETTDKEFVNLPLVKKSQILSPQLETDDVGQVDISVSSTAAELVASLPKPSEADELINEIEEADPINHIIPDRVPKVTKADSRYEELSLTKTYLQDREIKKYIKSTYGTMSSFEKLLDIEITKREATHTDMFERWLKEQYASAFIYLQDMSIGELQEISSNPNLRGILKKENIKYETFVEWVDEVPQMLEVIGEDYEMTFGELFARYFLVLDALDKEDEEVA